ncbi:hypothetical protein [Mycolicibacterium sp. XJ1904]
MPLELCPDFSTLLSRSASISTAMAMTRCSDSLVGRQWRPAVGTLLEFPFGVTAAFDERRLIMMVSGGTPGVGCSAGTGLRAGQTLGETKKRRNAGWHPVANTRGNRNKHQKTQIC